MLTIIPTHEEIKNAVFNLNKDSAPGPDGVGAIFFQTYWDIIKHDVYKAVLQFFTSSWLLPNFNANTLVLIPKTDNADTVAEYRPIAIANFKFKIISKILDDRLATIMPAITSVQQRGFIKGRCIKDCICLTSEAINVLHKRSFGGNLALKVDIAKAFDTLNWSFLLKVLHSFGFNSTFCNWIKSILESAKISISVNGKLHGFFSCSRGVRQGDPLSPLLFCLAEEVISRSITKAVREGKLNLIHGSRD
ncbi:RNA-directed DNA polymerase (Reverse transcriptase), partial [Trifolium medium]|nr:RNA-directed DNA polymerase (Reverse transcriptase) [Trifolium medium]